MELDEVLRRRRMVRTFLDAPVDPAVLERVLARAQRAPSAGYTQGFAFLLLEGAEETERFWSVVGGDDPEWPGEGVRAAPVLVVPLAGKDAYLDRYAEPDKGWVDRDEGRWPAPFWIIDTAFATMLMLLAAVEEGLGALFFGLNPPTLGAFREAYGVPGEWEPIGAVALGHPAPRDSVSSSAHTRARKPLDDVVHRNRW